MSGVRIRTAIALVILALMLMTSAVAAEGAEARATKVVRGVGTAWSPKVVRIKRGSTITWKAVSNTHTVTAYGGRWTFNRSLPDGSSVRHRFTKTGVFRFRCTIHSQLVNGKCQGMCGKVVVRVPAGSVALAGEFSGVYPRESPGGWQLIGTTGVAMWDLDRDPPALLRPGARVRFTEHRAGSG